MNKIFLILFIATALSDLVLGYSAECEYYIDVNSTTDTDSSNLSFYQCFLSTNQDDFNDKLTKIYGAHEAGKNDNNVDFLLVIPDNKLKTFSSIFCRKFSNLKTIRIEDAKLESADEDSMLNCKDLDKLMLYENKIRQLPKNLLTGNSKLTFLRFDNNQLATLPENFLVSQKELKELGLNGNKINFLPNDIFGPLLKLEALDLSNNKLESINPKWLENLQNLKWLSLNGNQISAVPSKIFKQLENLKTLYIYENKIGTLKSDSFDGLQNLKLLSLSRNQITDLPAGVFTQLTNLKVLALNGNQLSIIHSDSFSIHNQLTTIDLRRNKINAIGPKVIDNTAVKALRMEGNICSKSLFTTRNEIKAFMTKCFDNYEPRVQSMAQVQNLNQSAVAKESHGLACGKQVAAIGNIVGGKRVNRGEYPWTAALMTTNDKFFCGRTIVTNRKVVTAAHCIHQKDERDPILARDMLVLLGAYNLKRHNEVDRATFSVQSINMHPDWNPQAKSYDADITVLVLEKQVTFEPNIQPICLPNDNIKAIAKGHVVGYGRSENTVNYENIPKILEIPIHKNEDCFIKYNLLATISSRRTFCGGTGNGTGVCRGDSGSGMIVNDGSAYYLRGIVSSSLLGGKYECDLDAYAVFTDVTKFVDWIYSVPTSRFK